MQTGALPLGQRKAAWFLNPPVIKKSDAAHGFRVPSADPAKTTEAAAKCRLDILGPSPA